MKKESKLLLAVRKALGVIIEQGDDGFACQIPRSYYDLCVIVSWGLDWDHVSVHSRSTKGGFTPSWEDMAYIKKLFFKPSETAVQFHPSSDSYINCHENTLHIWRPQKTEIELPPKIMV